MKWLEGFTWLNNRTQMLDATTLNNLRDVINGHDDSLSGKQPADSDLTAIAALTPANDDVIQRKSGAWTNRTVAQLKSDLAIASDISTAVNALVAGAPGALDTLNELATALGDDANFSATVTAALAGKISYVTTLTGAAIQSAMTSFGGSPGVVMLKPGAVYTQTTSADQLVMPSNITLMMNGATLKLNTATGVGITQVVNSDVSAGNSNISIIGPGVIDGNQSVAGHQAGANMGIEFHKCSYVTLDNLEVKNTFRNGIYINGEQAAGSRYVNLTNLVVHDCLGSGIWVANGQRAVNWTNVTVHDCTGDSSILASAPSVVIDASEQLVNGLYVYGNAGSGIYIRNVFACDFSNLVATRNGCHGIYIVALTDSVGGDWLAINNGDATSNTYSDIYFEGTGSPTWGYGTTASVVITGIRCGNTESVLPNWKSPHGGAAAEKYAMYFEDLIGSFGGDVRLLNVKAVAGLTSTFRYPATMGNLVIMTGKEGWDTPSTATVMATATPKNVVGITTSGYSASNFFNSLRQNSGTQNDYAEWDVALGAGTWKLDLFHLASTNCGIYTVTVDGVAIGTLDGYNAAANTQTQSTTASFTITTPGRHTIRFAMLTKNAAASAYRAQLNGFTLTRTGA